MKKWIDKICNINYVEILKNNLFYIACMAIVLSLPIFQIISSRYSFSIPQQLVGTFFYLFIPGYFLTRVIFKDSSPNIFEIISLSIGFSITLPPLLILFIYKIILPDLSLAFFNLYLIYLFFAVICLISEIIIGFSRSKTKKGNDAKVHYNQKDIALVFIFVTAFIFLSFIFSSRQENIITADSSYFYRIAKTAIENHSYSLWMPNIFPPSAEFYQPLFQFGIISWKIFSSIDLIFLFRFGFTFSMGFLLFPLFLLIRKITEKRNPILVLTLFFCVPVLMTEISIARPQTLLFYLTPLFFILPVSMV